MQLSCHGRYGGGYSGKEDKGGNGALKGLEVVKRRKERRRYWNIRRREGYG